jgi:hypothetical protein
MGLGSGIRKKPIPDPGSRGQKGNGSGSATLLYSTVYHLVESELERDERFRLHALARLVHDADRNAAELILRTTWQRRSSARLQEMVPHLLKEKIKFETSFYVGVHILQTRVDQVTAG